MMRGWMGVAVTAGCLGLVQAARAQAPDLPPGQAGLYPFANVTGAARSGIQEPIGVAAGTVPNPANPTQAAPNPTTLPKTPGLPDPVILPDGPGAFPTKTPQPEEACYFHLGYQGLFRQKVNSGSPIAVLDAQNLDTGNAPSADRPVIERLADLHTPFQSGLRGTLGLITGDNQAFELSGFVMFQSRTSVSVSAAGQVDSPFFNVPLGFEGDNGLWLQADRQSTTFTSELWELEGNYRVSSGGIEGADLIFGVRYADLDERLSTYTDDDGIQFPLTNGQPDPTRVATYSVRTHNRLLAPQLGFEWNKLCAPYFALGLSGKAALGADFVDLNRRLVRGDGFVGFNGNNNSIQFAQTYELSAFVDLIPLERVKIHLGYTALWMVDLADVVGQYDFNLENTGAVNNRSGSVFFHGPVAEIQILF